MNGYMLDTNAFSVLYDQRLRVRYPALAAVVQRCIGEGAELAISAMTFYESLRGLLALGLRQQGATKRREFERLIKRTNILLLGGAREGWTQAAELWAQLTVRGIPLTDGDLLIATTALLHRRRLICGDKAIIRGLEALGYGEFIEPLT